MRNSARSAVALLAFLSASIAVWAAEPANRILSSPSKSDTPIARSVPGRVHAAVDLGQAPLDQALPAVSLHFSRTSAQQTALNTLIANQQNPASALYHKWLSPDQFRDQFGLPSADMAKVSAWLSAEGLKVTGSSYTNTSITVSGTVAQVQRAFNVSLHSVRVNGEQHITNVTDPVLPAAIANVTRGITGLSDFRPKPRVALRPAYTTSSGDHYVVPSDINTIYDLKPLLASAIDGTGISIAVMGQTAISVSDVASFRSAAGLATNAPNTSYTPTNLAVSGDDLAEAQLDVEWSGAIAPDATINYVAVSSDQGGAFQALVNSISNTPLPARIISISYGTCETQSSANEIYVDDQYFQQAGSQGQTIIGPGGDSGATDCDYKSASAADGLSVDFPASSPNVTGVGGTMFAETSGVTYWNTTNGSSDQSSALSYIPEAVWNETATYGSLAAGGGGASIYFSKPSWQVGAGVPADSARDVPDIALDAAVNHDGYLICVSGSCTNGFLNASGAGSVVGGTSVGVPIFAGMVALLEQKIGATTGLGNINPKLYGLASSYAGSVFHDVTSGTNSSPCVVGSPNCPTTSSTSNPTIGYTATTGYDLASGWGSVDGNNFANLWKSAAATGATSSTGSALSATTVSFNAGTASCGITPGSLILNASVVSGTQGLNTTPTGSVQLFIDGTALGSTMALSSGTATFTLNTASLSSGAHSVAVAYSGDSTYAGSRGNLSPSLSPAYNYIYVPSFIDVALTGSPDFSVTPCQPTLSVAAGGSGSTPITITGLNGFAGNVTLTASSDGTLQGSYTFSSTQVAVSSSGAATSTFNFNAYYQNTTTSAHLSPQPGSGRHGMAATGVGGAALATLLFLTLPRRRRYIGLLALVVSVGAVGTSGCGKGVTPIAATGGSSTGVNNNVDTSPGYYIINVTATGTNSAGQTLVHTAYLTLAVTQ